jgi:NAD(P)-dependent dehydrogenase (short-subunit alcohol dehydrogenase family)
VADRPVAIVTGAGGGVGSATVEVLGELGYLVIGVDLRPESGADEHVAVDLGSPGCGEEISAALGDRPLAGLVNNAAVAVYTSIEETPVEVWDEVVHVNLRAAFLVGKAVLPNLRQGKGAVVNVSSVHAEGTSIGIAAYAASKGGLLALTRAMALEWAADGIRVNCVLPGAVDTPMLAEGLFRSGSSVESLGARHPLGRVGNPREVAQTIGYLLGSQASFVTGASLRVDGGALARLSTE